MQIQFGKNSYEARALPLSAQRLVNFFAEAAPKDAKDPLVLYGTPGIKEFCDPVGDGPIRAMEIMDGLLYVMSGCRLYSVSRDCIVIALGSIGVGASSTSTSVMGDTSEASATFQITGGSDSAGVNQITSITVDGIEIVGAIDWSGSNAATALLVVSAINDSACKLPVTYDVNSTDVSAESGTHKSLTFRPDGLKMYTASDVSSEKFVFQYQIADPWNLTSAAYENITLDYTTVDTGALFSNHRVFGIKFNNDGTKLFLLYDVVFDLQPGAEKQTSVLEYSLTNAYEINSATFSSRFDVTASVGFDLKTILGLDFNDTGTKMLLTLEPDATSLETVYQFTLSTAFSVSTASYDSVSFALGGQDSQGSNATYATGGKKIFAIGNLNNRIYEYDLSTAYNLSTIVYNDVSFDVSSEDATPRALFFGNNCQYLFVMGNSNDAVFRYSFSAFLYGAILVGANGDRVTITAADGTGEPANGLSVAVTTAGDVQVDDNNLTMAGAFTMPAIVTFTGGGGIPPNCTGKVSMSHNAADPSQLIIVDGTNGWIFDTTNGLVQVTDGDYFSADVVDFQDQYFVQNRAGTGQFFLSNLNDGTAYTATDIATAEGDPDKLVSLISQRRELWLFGAETIEIWYNSGNADFPFSRFEGGFLERGCAAAFSIAEDDNSIFWLGEDRIFYRADGYQPVRISQHGIEEALRKYVIVDDACAFIYTMSGHKFYVCTFPAAGATWVYDISTSLWHERHSFGMERWRVSTYAEAYGKHLVGDFKDGKIGELDLDTYQEYGLTMQGQATGPVVYADRKRIFHRRFELDIEAGTGLTTGQGSDPQVWLDWSDDGGHTFSARKPFRSMGKIGAYMQRLRWLSLGSARQRIYRLTVSDPVKRSIIAAHLDAEAGDH